MKKQLLFFFATGFFSLALSGCGAGAGGEERTDDSGEANFLLFVGTYTKPEPHVDGKAEGIYQMIIDRTSGQLTMQGLTKDVVNPSFLAISPDRRFLYAVNEVGADVAPDGWIAAFRIGDPQSPRPILLDREVSGGSAPCHLVVDPSGRYLLVANYGGGVAVLPVNADGSLEPTIFELDLEGDGKASHPHMVCFSPDGRYLYVPDKGTDRVNIFFFDAADGVLVPAGTPYAQLKAGAGPRHMVFHPNGRFAYVINELDNTVAAFTYDPLTGMLNEQQTIGALPAGYDGVNFGADIHVSPDGAFLYASNRGHNSIVIYRVDAEAGTLTLVGHKETRGEFPRNFMILPNGEFLYVANQNTDKITIFRRDAGSGELSFVGQYEVPTPVCLKVW